MKQSLNLNEMGLVPLCEAEMNDTYGGGDGWWEWLAKEAITHFGDITDGFKAGWKNATK